MITGTSRLTAAALARLGAPAFWLPVIAFVAVPSGSALLLAFSPRLFGQGSQWFTLRYLGQAVTGATAAALASSLWVSAAAACLGVAVGLPLAWLAGRTTLPGRRTLAGSMWLGLLLPSWLPALGWQRLAQPDGVLDRLGLGSPWIGHLVMGPPGIVLLLVLPMLAPAIWSALAIGFAEAISDFGVAFTLAYNSGFTLATYQLYADIADFPADFPGASALGLLLVAAVAVPLAAQGRALRGRGYQVLSGRARQAPRRRLGRAGTAAAVAAVGLYYLAAVGVPGFGAVSGSLLADFGGSFSLTLANYRAMIRQPDQAGPLGRSIAYGAIAATLTVAGALVAAWTLSQSR